MPFEHPFLYYIKQDARYVLSNEPRPNMYWPHLYDENYLEEFYYRCGSRLMARIPSFVRNDTPSCMDTETDMLKDFKLILFLIEETPKDFFCPDDLAAYKEEIGMKIMARKLKGTS